LAGSGGCGVLGPICIISAPESIFLTKSPVGEPGFVGGGGG
jgi:hypothetical protein